MSKVDIWNLWIILLLIINRTTAEINLSPYALWNQNGETVAGLMNGTSGSLLSQLSSPIGISISIDDVLYVTDNSNDRIIVVQLDSITAKFAIGSNQFVSPTNTFVTNSSLYVNDVGNQRIQMFSLNGSNPTTIFTFASSRTGSYLYVDNDANIYFSNPTNHTVLFWILNSTNISIVAGTGMLGNSSNQLNKPYGLFVNSVGTIYIADCYNHRIMKWFRGSTSGIIVAGDGTSGSSSTQVNLPADIIVDTNEYMYISESGNSRITRWAPNSTFGVCIAACTGISGTASTQLDSPLSLAFDSNGSLYVGEYGNHRVQKFQILDYHSISYNQPKLSASAIWNPNAITFATSNTVGVQPHGIFINKNNTIYVPAYGLNRVQLWLESSTNPIRNITANLVNPYSVFITSNGDIYMDNGYPNRRVDKLTPNGINSVTVMYVNNSCNGLFVDIYDNIYCSMDLVHSVIKKVFNDNASITKIVAGTGSSGAASNMLNGPRGIFVDTKLNLYVAECYNRRIQFFQFGQLNGTTIAGPTVAGTTSLTCPTGVILDADGYLFIADSQNDRIIGSGPNGFRCIVGCSNASGAASNQLHQPWALSFDSYGNLYITDMLNNRIQKFLLISNSCNETTTSEQIGISTISADEISTDNMHTTDYMTSYITSPTANYTTNYTTGYTTGYTTSYITSTANYTTNYTTGYTTSYIASYTTTHNHSNQQSSSSSSFVPMTCSNLTSLGLYCNITNTPCQMFQPCLNNGTCININITSYDYNCSCLSGFNGIQCEYDYRPCKTNTCWNNGICYETSNTTFSCHCATGWQGIQCETKIDYCENIVCLNNGICQSLLLNYTCKCLGDSYSGSHCEITSNRITVLKLISKSFAYVAIIAIVSVAIFIITLDLLKYCFGIDPINPIRQKIQSKKVKKPVCIIRYTYVNSTLSQIPTDTISYIEETSI